MAIPSLPPLGRTAEQLQRITLAVLPHGGQRAARRNAGAALAADAAAARARREAESALRLAAQRSQATAVGSR